MGSSRPSLQGQCSGTYRTAPFAILLLLVITTQGARIFRTPEPHLPVENLPAASEQRTYSDIHSAVSIPRSAGDDDSYFAPGAWRPVRDPDFGSSGRRRVSSLATSGNGGDLQVASARNLRHEDGESAGSSEARTTPPLSANSPTTTLGHSIALVANQLLQGSDILESRSPEGSTTTSINAGSWPQASLDVRTPPKLMLQISGQKNSATSDEDPGKSVAPIHDDPMGENFFPSRRQPSTVTQRTSTTPGMTVTQMMVSTVKENQSKEAGLELPLSSVVLSDNKKDEKRPLTTTSTISNSINYKKPSPATTTPSPSTSPTAVRWKIAIPPNRQVTRFPPRKPATAEPTTVSSFSSNTNSTKKDSKPVNSGPTNSRPNTNSGGIMKPIPLLGTSRRPTQTTVRDVTTPRSIATTAHLTITPTSHSSFMTTSRPTITTTTQSTIISTSRPTVTINSKSTPPDLPKQTLSTSTTTPPKKEIAAAVQLKKPLPVEKEIVSEPKVTAVIKTDNASKNESTVITTEEPPSSTTTRRPSNKRKKNKNRRRRPSKKPAITPQADASSSGTELEVKESPQEENTGNVASPLSTRIYNFIAREVMPSMSVGLLGLVVTAGLAGYFLLPSLGGLQRRSDVATDGLMPGYGGGGAYGVATSDQDDEGGIVKSIFQNVMASVRNGEKEFERGPRRRRNILPADEAENEVDATLYKKDSNEDEHRTYLVDVTTPLPTTNTPYIDSTTDQSKENSSITSGGEFQIGTSTEGSVSVDEGFTTTEETLKDENPTQDLTPTYEWEGNYQDNPLSLMGILRRIADFKLRLGVGLLRATTDVIARYLEDVQHRLRDSDRHDWLRNLGSTVRRIGRSIDPPPVNPEDDSSVPYPRKRFSRLSRTRRHG